MLIVTSSYPSMSKKTHSGAGEFVRDFARAMAQEGMRVTVVTQRKGTAPCEDPGVDVVTYPWSGVDRPALETDLARLGDLRHIGSILRGGIKALRTASSQNHVVRCLCMWAVPAGYMAMKALEGSGIPYDVWCLGSDIWRYGRRLSTRWLVRKVLRSAEYVFADGFTLAEEVQGLVGRDCRFLPSSRMLPSATESVPKLVTGKPNLLFIGRWHPNKGVDLLPEAMRLLRQGGVDAHLHLFGGGMLESDLMRLISLHRVGDCIAVHGYADVDTAAAYLRTCDLLLIPSRIESIPVIFSDAVKCRIPVVAAEVGDLGRVVRKYQVGETARPELPGDLARSIRRALESGRCRYEPGMIEAGTDFDPRVAVRRYLECVGCPE